MPPTVFVPSDPGSDDEVAAFSDDLRELPGYQYGATSALSWFRPKLVLEPHNANEHHFFGEGILNSWVGCPPIVQRGC